MPLNVAELSGRLMGRQAEKLEESHRPVKLNQLIQKHLFLFGLDTRQDNSTETDSSCEDLQKVSTD